MCYFVVLMSSQLFHNKVNWSELFACDQGCIRSADSDKIFLKQKQAERFGDKNTWICPIDTHICNYWTNDYTLEQLDAGKSVQGGIECVAVCHLDN